MVLPEGMSSGGHMDRQLASQPPLGCTYKAIPTLGVTRILPNPVRLATLTTTAEPLAVGGLIWAWAPAAMPVAATVEPPARSAATIALAVQDRPPVRRRENLINTPPICREHRPSQSGSTGAARSPVHDCGQVSHYSPRGKSIRQQGDQPGAAATLGE